MNDKENKRILTASELMDILKDIPEDTPIVIIKDASDNRDDGCYHVTEVAKLYSDYEEKKDAIGFSISNNTAEFLTSNFDHTVWRFRKEKEND